MAASSEYIRYEYEEIRDVLPQIVLKTVKEKR